MSDDVAGRLTEALVRAGIERGLGRIDADIVARLLLPVVREIADQRAAEELEATAEDFARDDNGAGGKLVALGLAARAAALRGEADA